MYLTTEFLAQEGKRHVTFTKSNLLMLLRKAMELYYEYHTKCVNVLCGKMWILCMPKYVNSKKKYSYPVTASIAIL
jgi:hypothetical protein